MNIRETVDFLAKVAIYDNRKIETTTALAWEEALEDISFNDAMMALGQHVRESREYLTPAHIVALVRAMHRVEYRDERVQQQLERQQSPRPAGAPMPDNFDAMVAAARDPRTFAQEVAIYDAQLEREGYAPTGVSVGVSPAGYVTVRGRL